MNKGSVAAGAGSNLRVRLFWKLQAWRLRNTVAPETSRSVSQFSNFMALSHRGNADAICDLAESLSTHSTELSAISAAAVKTRLARELGPKSCVTVLGAEKGSIGGYAWARVSTPAEALDNYRCNADLVHIDDAAWDKLAGILGTDSCLVFYDLGLCSQYRRGFSPLKQLLKPLLELGLGHGAGRAFWWAPAGSAACQLSLAFGARAVLQHGDRVFFLHEAIAGIARVLTALPASAISTLLGRAAGARAPREPSRSAATLRLPMAADENLIRLALDSSAAGASAPVRATELRKLVASNDVADNAADDAEAIEEIEIRSRPRPGVNVLPRGKAAAAVADTGAPAAAVGEVTAAEVVAKLAPVRRQAMPKGALADLPRRLSTIFPHRTV
ncbi:hypothetical protein [Tahibacter harae]|uniref:hypothetical protein n=1 Tax=Tahibacter harae TaxID=2963937 RepID=UPI00210972C5|nr:hypothetical protein [Tahibacter harae]